MTDTLRTTSRTGGRVRRAARAAPSPDRLLGIYLNDHLAGAGAGVALARRMARTHRDTPAGPRLAEMASEIAEDQDSLREAMTALDVPLQWPRTAVGRLAEKVGRAKLNGRLVRRSPLSDLIELEALRLGVEGKGALWRALLVVAASDTRLDRVALARLAERAERQARLLESLRLDAVHRAFEPGPASQGGTADRRHGPADRRHGLRRKGGRVS
ncbi:hypothetical protein ACFWUZ_11895 [Streptomyces sp. NPDC058646]|uniref:hypothetical protein n=1 Tax=Streptomyces sp. NPDC058646 TaxID=3346574 RepID=UPI00365D8884